MPGTASPTPQRQPAQGPHEAPTEPIAAAPRSAGARRRGGPSGNGAATVRRERQRRRRRGIRVLLVLALILLPFVLAVGWFAYQLRPGSDGPPVRFEIESGMGTSEVADALAEVDPKLSDRITAEAIDRIVHLIPDAWLVQESPFVDSDQHREAYSEYLRRRLEWPHSFVEEAIRARSLCV